MDHQVKIRGFRIEPGEIEQRLLAHESVTQAVVIESDGYLCAYIAGRGHLETGEINDYLTAALPAYMIPAHIVQLDTIPLTANGKVDRKKLPQPGITAREAYVPPGNEVEKKLARLWQEVLELDEENPVGIDDNFFQLGGHSLRAAALAAKIQHKLGVTVPLADLFKHSTVRTLARLMSPGTRPGPAGDAVMDDNLVLVRTCSDETKHMFFIHAGSGEIQDYVQWCNLLEPGFNYWAIRANRLSDCAPPAWTVEELARSYIGKIKKIQPHGPYQLGGWCIGGTIAFEMVRQLEQRGEEIARFTLVSVSAPNLFLSQRSKDFTLESERDWLGTYFPDEKLEERLARLTQVERLWTEAVKYFEETAADPMEIKNRIPAGIKRAIPGYDRLDMNTALYYMNIIRSLDNARNRYIPCGPVKTPVHFFQPGHMVGRGETKIIEQWNNYTAGGIRFYEVPGDHYSIFKPPYVKAFAEAFNRVMKTT
jgi:thioesterase domain-containing protein/acyl carrier protein